MATVSTDNGFWITLKGNILHIRCDDDHYREIHSRGYKLADGGTITVNNRIIFWGPDGGDKPGKTRILTNTPALRQWLAAHPLVRKNGGIWSRHLDNDAPDVTTLARN